MVAHHFVEGGVQAAWFEGLAGVDLLPAVPPARIALVERILAGGLGLVGLFFLSALFAFSYFFFSGSRSSGVVWLSCG